MSVKLLEEKELQHINSLNANTNRYNTVVNWLSYGWLGWWRERRAELEREKVVLSEQMLYHTDMVDFYGDHLNGIEGKSYAEKEDVLRSFLNDERQSEIREGDVQKNITQDLLHTKNAMVNIDTGWVSYAAKYKKIVEDAQKELYALTGAIDVANNSVGSSIDGYYSEIERELLKAQAVGQYWQEELAIAEALNKYAQETASSAETAGETEASLTAATNGYKTALTEYNNALAVLEAEQDEINGKAIDLQAVSDELAVLQGNVNTAREAYSAKLLALSGIEEDTLKQKIVELMVQMDNGYEKNGEESNEALNVYYADAMKYAEALNNLKKMKMLSQLQYGNDSQKSIEKMVEFSKNALSNASKTGTDIEAETGIHTEQGLMAVSQTIKAAKGAYSEILDKEVKEADGTKIYAAEKASLEEVMKAAWGQVDLYWTQQIKERNVAIKYINEGEMNGANLTSNAGLTEADLRRMDLKSWLTAQNIAIEKELELVRADKVSAEASAQTAVTEAENAAVEAKNASDHANTAMREADEAGALMAAAASDVMTAEATVVRERNNVVREETALADAETAVTDAETAVTDAENALTDAKTAVIEAEANLATATEKAIDARVRADAAAEAYIAPAVAASEAAKKASQEKATLARVEDKLKGLEELKGKLGDILLQADNVEFDIKVNEYRADKSDGGLFFTVLQKQNIFSEYVGILAEYEYEKQREASLGDIERERRVADLYSDYARVEQNKEHNEARAAVNTIIASIKIEDLFLYGIEVGSLAEYVSRLREEGEGLNQTGIQALEGYIGEVISYLVVKEVYNEDGTLKISDETKAKVESKLTEAEIAEMEAKTGIKLTESEIATIEEKKEAEVIEEAMATERKKMQEAFDAELEKVNKLQEDYQEVYDAKTYWGLFAEDWYEGADAEVKTAMVEYGAELLIEKLSEEELDGADTAEKIKAIVKEKAAEFTETTKATEWAVNFEELAEEIQGSILEEVVELCKIDDEYSKYEVLISWIKVLTGESGGKTELALKDPIYKANDIIQNYYKASDFLFAYDRMLASVEETEENKDSLFLEYLSSENGDEFFTNTEAKLKEYITLYNDKNKAENNDLYVPYNFEQVFIGKLIKALEVESAGKSLEQIIVETCEEIENELFTAVNEDESENGAENGAATKPKTKAENTFKGFEEELTALKESLFTEYKEKTMSEYEARVASDSVQQRMQEKVEKDTAVYTQDWYTFYLAGEDLLYMWLLSPYGKKDIESALTYLESDSAFASKDWVGKVKEYKNVQDVAGSYAYFADGDIATWMENPDAMKGLSNAEKEQVENILVYGIPIPDTMYNEKEYKEGIKGVLEKRVSLEGMKGRERKVIHEYIEKLTEEQSKKTEDASFALQIALAKEQEVRQNRLEWIKDSTALDVKTFENIGSATKDTVERMLADGKGALLARLKERAAEQGIFFDSNRPEYDFALNAGVSTDDEILNIAINEAQVKMNTSYMEYRGIVEGDTGIRIDIERFLVALEDVLKGDEVKQRELTEAEDALKVTEAAYKDYRAGDYEKALVVLQGAYDVYNKQYDVYEEKHKALKVARVEERKAQEINDWASSIYLQDFSSNTDESYVSPKEKLSEVQYASDKAQIAVQVLEQIKDGEPIADKEYNDALTKYKEDYERYYLGRVIKYEADLAQGKQEQIVRDAEAEERSALNVMLQAHKSGEETEKTKETEQMKMVRVIKEDGKYKVVLATEINSDRIEMMPGYYIDVNHRMEAKEGIDAQDNEILSDYFNKDEKIESVDGIATRTQAELDTRDWLDRMLESGTYFEDLMLASMYMKMKAQGAQKEELLNGIENPDNYSLGDFPDEQKFHGVDVKDEYEEDLEYRLRSAYTSVMGSEAGQADLAKYLLYRDTTLSANLNIRNMEKNVLETRALEDVSRKIERERNTARNVAIVNGAISAGFMAGAIPFCLWLLIPAAAFAIIAGTYGAKAGALNDLNDYVEDLDREKETQKNVDANGNKTALAIWREKNAELVKQQKILNKMYYGTEEKPQEGSTISYGNFLIATESLLYESEKALGKH